MAAVKQMHFDGPCPFLTCLKTEPHDHPICPKCGAVRYGNLYCEECRNHLEERRAEFQENMNLIKEAK